ncbi:hypothetical protein [Yinghuangia seranimata]|uniref:hypothetical protein n=1 Tax=Yinghuangia seranimata TaxID=408067 RepID=UPI00248C50FE|nr:hypothetical protein [Yinghuangia seranimata]MDI2124622.1 hypothetical protein [Yinghuangia seranimata]
MTPDDDVQAGLARLDGYLYWQHQLAEGRAYAEAAADHLPWMTTAQREDLVRVLSAAHTEMARGTVRQLATRAQELRAEYEQRYRGLRRRMAVTVVTATALAAALAGLTTPWLIGLVLVSR